MAYSDGYALKGESYRTLKNITKFSWLAQLNSK
jgi:hypothetical protein